MLYKIAHPALKRDTDPDVVQREMESPPPSFAASRYRTGPSNPAPIRTTRSIAPAPEGPLSIRQAPTTRLTPGRQRARARTEPTRCSDDGVTVTAVGITPRRSVPGCVRPGGASHGLVVIVESAVVLRRHATHETPVSYGIRARERSLGRCGSYTEQTA